MPVVFSKEDNAYWPLPADYPELGKEGMRLARVNAASLQGRPDLDVAAWAFFREYYLFPTPDGMFYKHGVKPSPKAHYGWVYDWGANRLTVNAAPRSAAKSVIVKENILRKTITRPYYETVKFLAKSSFVADAMEVYMNQITGNERIIEDFGKMRPPRNQGIWNHSQITLTNGAMITGMSISGASLGKRPHELWFDDVEKDDSLVLCPSTLIEAFKGMLFNVVFPMAEWDVSTNSGVAIRIIGTLLSRRTFIYWMQTSEDPRLQYWFRTLQAATMYDADGNEEIFWEEKMGREWQERQKFMMGHAAFAAQYMNDPGTEADRVLKIHPELNTFWMDTHDEALQLDPLNSKAKMVCHQLTGWTSDENGRRPDVKKLVREYGKAVSGMRRYITVDYAPTTTESSDYSCIHVLGYENSDDFRDTLWSLDIDVGKYTTAELVQRIYRAAMKWGVPIIGVEAYSVQAELYERLQTDLPELYGEMEVVPRVLPLKFPPSYSKADKISGLEWRFNQFRIKLPIDRRPTEFGYQALFQQIEDFTKDMALLRHDDAIDTLAMHQVIGKPRRSAGPDVVQEEDPIEMLRNGQTHYDSGLPIIGSLPIQSIPIDALRAALDHQRARQLEESPLVYVSIP